MKLHRCNDVIEAFLDDVYRIFSRLQVSGREFSGFVGGQDQRLCEISAGDFNLRPGNHSSRGIFDAAGNGIGPQGVGQRQAEERETNGVREEAKAATVPRHSCVCVLNFAAGAEQFPQLTHGPLRQLPGRYSATLRLCWRRFHGSGRASIVIVLQLLESFAFQRHIAINQQRELGILLHDNVFAG
jgi:hypothetical protein